MEKIDLGNVPMGIQKTTDYSQFKLLKGNRLVQPGHLASLTVSISKKNMLAQNPIIINENFQVIDGQHRLEVAKANNLEIYYIVVPGARIEEVVQLNASAKIWKIRDYIDSYATLGNENYIWLLQFMEEYNLTYTQAVYFIFGVDVKWSAQRIKSGNFEVTEQMRLNATNRADILWDLRPHIKRVGILPKAVYNAIVTISDKDLGKRFIENVRRSGKPIEPKATKKEAMEQLMAYTKPFNN